MVKKRGGVTSVFFHRKTMATSLYKDESVWSDDDDDKFTKDSQLFASQGYVSLSSMPQKQHKQHASQASWVLDEKLQRSTSFAHYPKHFNSKKAKHHQSHPQSSKLNRLNLYRPKMNKTDYISLFPKIDLLIWYLPMYILRNRSNKCKKHYILLSICILAVLFSIYGQCWMVITIWLNPESEMHNTARGIFYFVLYLNPYIGSCLRFHFFCYKFDWSLWHKKKDQTESNSPRVNFCVYIISLHFRLQNI